MRKIVQPIKWFRCVIQLLTPQCFSIPINHIINIFKRIAIQPFTSSSLVLSTRYTYRANINNSHFNWNALFSFILLCWLQSSKSRSSLDNLFANPSFAWKHEMEKSLALIIIMCMCATFQFIRSDHIQEFREWHYNVSAYNMESKLWHLYTYPKMHEKQMHCVCAFSTTAE